jgi:hypothetical protein
MTTRERDEVDNDAVDNRVETGHGKFSLLNPGRYRISNVRKDVRTNIRKSNAPHAGHAECHSTRHASRFYPAQDGAKPVPADDPLNAYVFIWATRAKPPLCGTAQCKDPGSTAQDWGAAHIHAQFPGFRDTTRCPRKTAARYRVRRTYLI